LVLLAATVEKSAPQSIAMKFFVFSIVVLLQNSTFVFQSNIGAPTALITATGQHGQPDLANHQLLPAASNALDENDSFAG